MTTLVFYLLLESWGFVLEVVSSKPLQGKNASGGREHWICSFRRLESSEQGKEGHSSINDPHRIPSILG